MKTWITVLLVIAILFLILFGIGSAYQKSHPYAAPDLKRHKFVRAVVLLDHTISMGNADLKRAREILKTKIIQSCGPGDELICLTIGPVCERDEPVITAQLGFPTGLNRTEAKSVFDGHDAYKINEMVDQVAASQDSLKEERAAWLKQVDNVGLLSDDGSDYTRQFEQAKSILAKSDDTEVENVLIAIGDFIEDRNPYGSCSRALKSLNVPTPPSSPQALRGVRVVLVCTTNRAWVQGNNNGHWTGYFGNNKLTATMFAAAVAGGSLLPPNPLLELKRIEAPSFWKAFLPYLLAIIGCVILLLAIHILSWLAWFDSGEVATLEYAQAISQEPLLTPAAPDEAVHSRSEEMANRK